MSTQVSSTPAKEHEKPSRWKWGYQQQYLAEHWERFSFYLLYPGKWYSSVDAIKARFPTLNYYTLRKLERYLDTEILPNQSAPKQGSRIDPRIANVRPYLEKWEQHPEGYIVNKDRIETEEQARAFLPPGRELVVRSRIFKAPLT